MKLLTTRGLVIVGSLVAFSMPVYAQDFPGSGFLCSTLSLGCPDAPPPPPPAAAPAPLAEEPAAPVKAKKRKKRVAKKAKAKKAAAAEDKKDAAQ